MINPATVRRHPVAPVQVQTPGGPVEVTMIGGGYNPATNCIGLGRFHGHGTELIVPEEATTGTIAGITVTDIPSRNTLFWNNISASQPAQLTLEQRLAVQEGIEKEFPGRHVVFDEHNALLNEFHRGLTGGGSQ